MKFAFSSFVSALSLVGCAAAQQAWIGAPADGTAVSAGSNITVMVTEPDNLSSSIEVAVVLAINSCHNTTCIPPADLLGSILYNGPFSPKFDSPPTSLPPHQNFTVTIPATLPKGPAQLALFHVSLIGAGPMPYSEVKNITLIVQ